MSYNSTKTGQQIDESVVRAAASFKQAAIASTQDGFVITITKHDGSTQTLTIRKADDSHQGIIGAPMYRRINKLPSDPTDVEKLRVAVVGLQNIEYGQSVIVLHTDLVNGSDDEWQIDPATPTTAGVMSASDKAMLQANRLRLSHMELNLASGATAPTIEGIFLKPGDRLMCYTPSSSADAVLSVEVEDGDGTVVKSNTRETATGAVALVEMDNLTEPGLYSILISNTGEEDADDYRLFII